MDYLLIIGVLAGIVQIIGYGIYIYLDHTYETIDPNPITWFMFAYGTFVLAILEWDSEATYAELIVPVVCSVGAIWVAWRCWQKARRHNPSSWWPNDWWPNDPWERGSFISDIVITIAYIGAWILASATLLTEEGRMWAVLIFLLLSNLSTFPQFWPIFSTTYKNPRREHWLPWFVWTVAYGLLGIVTYLTHGTFWHVLMFYPASNFILHAVVGIISLKKPPLNYKV